MLQLVNRTPFAAQLALFPDHDGIDTLFIIVKATFNIGDQWTLHNKQFPPIAADKFWADDTATSSIKQASDIHIGKPASDIVMTGQACAPGEQPIRQLDVSLSVGQISKTVRIFGDRVWENGYPSAPKAFTRMPVVYEKAFGGMHFEEGQIIAGESRNPVGCGFCGKRKPADMEGLPLPNLEDPAKLLQRCGDTVTPTGFGYIAPHWLPRLAYAGTYDEHWQKKVAPYLPADFDPRFFNMAHPDLVYPGYLRGGEAVSITGMHPRGPLSFALPSLGIKADVRLARGIENPKFDLETLLLEPNQLRMQMVWKSAVPCDKKALKIREVIVSMSGNNQQQAA